MEYIEFKGATKNDAITAACTHFSIPSSKLDYEVIEEGKAGFLGIGSKPAVIMARMKEESEIVEEKSESVNIITEDPVIASVKEAAEKIEEIDVVAIAKKFLEDVFKAMDLMVNMDIKYNDSLKNLDVELSGDEMGVLIGKRGQTLDSLQYLISLVVNKGTSEYIRVKVDTENYRERRKETLENLAKNISYKVKRTRRSVSLEPMNPYERRIIHSALQNDKYVTTHSEGEEPFRRVVVVPKKDANYSERSSYGRGGYGSGRGGYSKGGYNRSYNKNYKNANVENETTENTDAVGNNDNSSETEE